jgi:hypothetical protein
MRVRFLTIGHGTRPAAELVQCLRDARAETLVDVRRFPGSRRNPQFNQAAISETLAAAGIEYRHAVELGGRRSHEPGEERFGCIRTPAFRSYAARMGTREWQDALEKAFAEPSVCFMCAETAWQRCHRRFHRRAAGRPRSRGRPPDSPARARAAPHDRGERGSGRQAVSLRRARRLSASSNNQLHRSRRLQSPRRAASSVAAYGS